MKFLSTYSREANAQTRKLLRDSCDLFIDHAFDAFKQYANEYRNAKTDKQKRELFENSNLCWYLPKRFCHLYTPLFVKKYIVAASNMMGRMEDGSHFTLRSTIEEMILHALMFEAKGMLEDGTKRKGTSEEKLEFLDEILREDKDYLFLYEDSWDGFEKSKDASLMRTVNLKFEDWFKDFQGKQSHPYLRN